MKIGGATTSPAVLLAVVAPRIGIEVKTFILVSAPLHALVMNPIHNESVMDRQEHFISRANQISTKPQDATVDEDLTDRDQEISPTKTRVQEEMSRPANPTVSRWAKSVAKVLLLTLREKTRYFYVPQLLSSRKPLFLQLSCKKLHIRLVETAISRVNPGQKMAIALRLEAAY